MEEYKFGFKCSVRTKFGKLDYGPYRITKNGVEKELEITPPKVFQNVIFDILQEYIYYGGRINIRHTISYVNINSPKDMDIVCVDVASIQTEHKIEDRRPIIPCRYDMVEPITVNDQKILFGDVYHALISSNWVSDDKIELTQRVEPISHWCQRAGIVDLNFWVSRQGDEFKFSGDFLVRRHLLGEISGAVLIPEFPKPNNLPKHAVVAGAWKQSNDIKGKDILQYSVSSLALDNLNQLSRQLEYRAPQIIWVLGEPGSGKEVFAQALHAGSVISRGKNLQVRSAAGADLDEIGQRLYSSIINEKCLIEQVDGGGTIFLDEFDKVDASDISKIYSGMLRVLEAEEYIRVMVDWGGRSTEIAAKYKKVNWIFAGAFSMGGSEKVPRDFWSRLTGKINLGNPIEGNPEYAATLFLYFYVIETMRAYGQRSGLFLNEFIATLEKKYDERLFNEQIVADILGYGKISISAVMPIIPSSKLLKFSSSFSQHIRTGTKSAATKKRKSTKPVNQVDSSRSIRQAAKAAFFAMRQLAIESDMNEFEFEKAEKLAMKAAIDMLATCRGEI